MDEKWKCQWKLVFIRRKEIKILFGFLFVVFLSTGATAEAQSFWARTYGGSVYESADSIQLTSDGGSIVAGKTNSFGAGLSDLWIVKLDSAGNMGWQKTYGGSDDEFASSIQTTSDNGVIVAGSTESFGAGSYDFWILKLDSSGNLQWQKTYGGSGIDSARSIDTTSDGGFIVAGHTTSFGAGSFDFWVLKLDTSGNIQWQKTYGGSISDIAQSIQATSDGGSIVTGYTHSFGAGSTDFWILKLDLFGNVQWQKTYGGSGIDVSFSIDTTSDGRFIVAGYTDSFGAGSNDFWILKLDTSGNIQWQKTYGGSGVDVPLSIETTLDGGFIVAGETQSFGAGSRDFWILKLDLSGNIQWQKTYGGGGIDIPNSIQQTSSGRIFIAGISDSFGSGDSNAWILKLDSNGDIDSSCSLMLDTSVVPLSSSASPDGGAFSINESSATISSSTFQITNTTASMSEQCASSCTFCDNFEDGMLDPNWTYEKPAWAETGGYLIGTPTKKKAIAVTSPAFPGYTNGELEVSVMTPGGTYNKVWIYMHRADERNSTELLIKEENDKVILKHRINNVIVAKNKASVTIDPNTEYVFRIVFDGTQYNVFMNETFLFAMTPGGPVPNATVGVATSGAGGSFNHIYIN